MTSILILGFLVGFRHAFEPDHIAAMASLATRTTSLQNAIARGAVWGLGHTLTLFIVCSCVLVLNAELSDHIVQALETAVGVMLLVLGTAVVWKVYRDRIHFHIHKHADGLTHFHAHSHRGEAGSLHNPDRHNHAHNKGFPYRSLTVGLMHGMAGSAALIVLTLNTTQSIWHGLTYITIFGIGSIAGMSLFSMAICIPMRSVRWLTSANNSLQVLIGGGTISLGIATIFETLAI